MNRQQRALRDHAARSARPASELASSRRMVDALLHAGARPSSRPSHRRRSSGRCTTARPAERRASSGRPRTPERSQRARAAGGPAPTRTSARSSGAGRHVATSLRRSSRGLPGEQWVRTPGERRIFWSPWTDPGAARGGRPERATCRQGGDNPVDNLESPCVEMVRRDGAPRERSLFRRGRANHPKLAHLVLHPVGSVHGELLRDRASPGSSALA